MFKTFGLLFVFILTIILFYIFSFNSGYGYDALEYLEIARSLDDGYKIYDFVISKSWYWYVFIHDFMIIFGRNYNHYSTTALISIFFILNTLGVFFLLQKIHKNINVSLLGGVLQAASAFFMEMNFLEPEAPVVFLGIISYYFLIKYTNKSWFFAGLFLGISILFKSIGMFYVFGIYCFVFWQLLSGQIKFLHAFNKSIVLFAGFLVPILLSLLYFYKQGIMQEHIYWSYIYPFRSYPSHTLYLVKLFQKASWYFVLILISLWYLVINFRFIKNKNNIMLAFFIGCCSCIALLKTQASHYLFPSSAFFVIFIASIYAVYIKNVNMGGKKIQYFALISVFLVLLSIVFLRPDALARFSKLNDYAYEKTIKSGFDKYVGPSKKALILDNAMFFYFLSYKYPNVPFMHTEMQVTDYLKNHPDVFKKSLADSSLSMVVVGNFNHTFDDSTKSGLPHMKIAQRQLYDGLRKYFVEKRDLDLNLKIFIRKK